MCSVPNVHHTPGTNLVCLAGKLEVIKPLKAEEWRINDCNKLGTCTSFVMRCMRQDEPGHWDFGQFVEGSNGSLLYADRATFDMSKLEYRVT